MRSDGQRALNSFKKAVRSVEIQQAVPPSVNHPNAAFDSLPEPDAATLELFRSLTPRDAAGAYLAVALGPMRDSALLRDAQKALAVIKTLLVSSFLFCSIIFIYLFYFRPQPGVFHAPSLMPTGRFHFANSAAGGSSARPA